MSTAVLLTGLIHSDHMLVLAFQLNILVRIHKDEQLLDWPLTRLLLQALCIKTSNHLQVKGTDF